MIRFFILVSIFILTGCRNRNTTSTDPIENRYYRLYNEIYTQFGKLPADSIQQRLSVYLQEFPENADAQMLAGNIAYELGAYDSAVLRYKSAVSLHPQQAVYSSALGTVYLAQNQTDSAEKYLLKALTLKDSLPSTLLNASILYSKKEDWAKSSAYAQAVANTPNLSPDIYCGLSFVYNEWIDKEKSRQFYEKAVTLGLKDTVAFKQVLNGTIKLEDFYRQNYQH